MPAPEPPRPYTLVAELTYRCPLRCAYCSNPVHLSNMGSEIDTGTWSRVFAEAEAIGVMQVNLTGGEPLLRADLEEIVAAARRSDLYTTLITSGVPLTRDRLARLCDAGLDGVQLSLQDSDVVAAARIAGTDAWEAKAEVAIWVRDLGLPLTLNIVLHRENLPRLSSLITLAEQFHANRLELAHAQYLGWALENRSILLPTEAMIADARATIAAARGRLVGRMEILAVLPDYFSDRPRACMDGWGRRYLIVAPDGRVLPCHAAHTLPGLTFDNVTDRALAEIWTASDGFTRFRGEAWMPAPCRTCPERGIDFGGCRCQAYHLTGDMTVTDPSCALAPDHDIVRRARADAETATSVAAVDALTATARTICDADALTAPAATTSEPALIRLRRPPTVP
jgi:pyrroloquinoline quinone biosynthesis protein E